MIAKALKRNVFGELMEGVRAMGAHRKGRITLRSHNVLALSLPAVDERVIRTTREKLHMSRAAFAHRLGVNPEVRRLEAGRSKPNDQSAALILLVRKYADTLTRLETLAGAG